MWREPGVDLDLAPLLAGGSTRSGRGATRPCTSPAPSTSCRSDVQLPRRAALGCGPRCADLATMVRGLRATHGLAAADAVDYLRAADG